MSIIAITVCMLVLFLLQALYTKRTWDRGVDVRVQYGKSAVTEGEKVVIAECVENSARKPLRSLKVAVNLSRNLLVKNQENTVLSDKSYHVETFSLGSRTNAVRELECFCTKRGYYFIDEVVLIASDLFYSQRFVKNVPQRTSLYVYPGRVDDELLMQAAEHIIGDMFTRRKLIEDPFEFRGVRDYVNTDPLQKINWKMSAKAGSLQVNLFENTSGSEMRILLDVLSDQLVYTDSLIEEAVRIAASLAELLIERGINTSIVSNGVDLLTNTPLRIEAGAGEHHADNIKRGLARLDISRKESIQPFTELIQDTLEEMYSSYNHMSCILISCENSKSIRAAWNSISAGSEAYRIQLSHTEASETEGCLHDNIMMWRVPYGK